MKIKSTEFNDYFFLPNTCGYKFGNKTPILYIENVPSGTTNLALAVYDGDVTYYDRELTHWLAWDIPPDIGEFTNENIPPGVIEGTNDMGTIGYYGPTLYREIHHIHFLVFALDVELNLDASAGRREFDMAVNGNYIEHADLIGMYQPQEQQA